VHFHLKAVLAALVSFSQILRINVEKVKTTRTSINAEMARHRQVARESTGGRHLASICPARVDKWRAPPCSESAGGTRRDPGKLGRSAEWHFTRGPRVSSCRISDSPVLFGETFLRSRKYYDSALTASTIEQRFVFISNSSQSRWLLDIPSK